ncbi:uncharacterized protein LOC124121274 isoform X2 [Haliotis rufescens]|uniref:uncharacterized protein LOC124121274 isoform X2 n=1 Tax=Haliotis rufescens TaxID=6454 RepID=UPI00201F6EEB|nr:uncharacterized protein LOC124121274 isoform X2 [Haliotis rufescens]
MSGRWRLLLLVACLVSLPTISSTTWHDVMLDSCGSDVDLLFREADDYTGVETKCRTLRTVFLCVQKKSFENRETTFGWTFMTNTGQMDEMKKMINDTCFAESLVLCVVYTMQADFRTCYVRAGLQPREHFTEEYLSQHCDQMDSVLTCMRQRLLRCPDDDYVQPQVAGVRVWRLQLWEHCPTLPASGWITETDANNVDYDTDYGTSSSCRDSRVIVGLLAGIVTILCSCWTPY